MLELLLEIACRWMCLFFLLLSFSSQAYAGYCWYKIYNNEPATIVQGSSPGPGHRHGAGVLLTVDSDSDGCVVAPKLHCRDLHCGVRAQCCFRRIRKKGSRARGLFEWVKNVLEAFWGI